MKKKVFFIVVWVIMLLFIMISISKASNKYITSDDLTTIKLENKVLIAGFNYSQKLSEVSSKFSTDYTIKFCNKNGEEITDLNTTISTGQVIKAYTKSSNELKKEYTVVLYGDLNGDGTANALDALMVVKNKLKLLENGLKDEEIEAGRINQSTRDNASTPSSVDALGIVKYKLMSEQYPISQKPSSNSEQDIEEISTDVFVKLYDDGTLAFTATNRVLEGKTLVEDYGKVEEYCLSDLIQENVIPKWYGNTNAKYADIVDKIYPTSTVLWFVTMQEIRNIENLDTSRVTNMAGMFFGCNNLTSIDVSNFDTSNVTDMRGMFWGCNSLTSLDVSNFDTSNVINMSHMFESFSVYISTDETNASNLININCSNFNTSNVTDMSGMFSGCNNLTNINVSNFDTSNVTNMENMFYNCSSLTSIDVSKFDTSNVTNMRNMFYNGRNLTSIDVSKFNTSNVTNMENMFYNCSNLTSLDVSNFDTRKVTTMTKIFYNCKNLINLDVRKFDTSNIINMENMFYNCSNLTNLDVSNFDTSKVTNMEKMFYNCNNLTNLDLSNFSTSKVTNMKYMFYNCEKLTRIYVDSNKWKISQANVLDMFTNCGTGCVLEKSTGNPIAQGIYVKLYTDGTLVFTATDRVLTDKRLEKDYGIVEENYYSSYPDSNYPKWRKNSNIKYVDIADEIHPTKTALWFMELNNMTEIRNIENLDTSNVTDMNYMFYNCEKLINIDLSSFNTSNVTNMANMFSCCNQLRSVDLSNFNTSNVTSMESMFWACTNLPTLDLTNFNTISVTNMASMFQYCTHLISVDLSSFNTSNVTSMMYMFERCITLNQIYVNKDIWKTPSDYSGKYSMFRDCGTDHFTDKATGNPVT